MNHVHLSVFMIRCICGLLKNKCRVLVTHQLQHLKAADQILVLKEVCPPLEENVKWSLTYKISVFILNADSSSYWNMSVMTAGMLCFHLSVSSKLTDVVYCTTFSLFNLCLKFLLMLIICFCRVISRSREPTVSCRTLGWTWCPCWEVMRSHIQLTQRKCPYTASAQITHMIRTVLPAASCHQKAAALISFL